MTPSEKRNGVGQLNGMRPTSKDVPFPSWIPRSRLNSTDLFCAVKSQKCVPIDQDGQSHAILQSKQAACVHQGLQAHPRLTIRDVQGR